MEGRRVSRRKPRRNPLYVLFMGLLALSLVLMAVSGLVSRKKRRALCRRYGSSSQEDWQLSLIHISEPTRRS